MSLDGLGRDIPAAPVHAASPEHDQPNGGNRDAIVILDMFQDVVRSFYRDSSTWEDQIQGKYPAGPDQKSIFDAPNGGFFSRESFERRNDVFNNITGRHLHPVTIFSSADQSNKGVNPKSDDIDHYADIVDSGPLPSVTIVHDNQPKVANPGKR
jgi:hypothetical protein